MAARYDRLALLGSGSTGSVYRARRRADGAIFAYKIIKLAGFSTSQRGEILNEVDVMTQVRHPNVVAYEESFVEDDTLHIVMECCSGGDLAREIEARGGGHHHRDVEPSSSAADRPGDAPSAPSVRSAAYMEEEEIWSILVQVCEGLHHMHSVRVLHRDIKAENIYSDGDGAIKIGDLGLGGLCSGRSALLGSRLPTTPAGLTLTTRPPPRSAPAWLSTFWSGCLLLS